MIYRPRIYAGAPVWLSAILIVWLWHHKRIAVAVLAVLGLWIYSAQ